jgi:hypothetical protein
MNLTANDWAIGILIGGTLASIIVPLTIVWMIAI